MDDAPNPFELSDESENEGNEAPPETSSMAELRKAYNRAEKDRKALAAQVEELASFRENVVQEKRQAAVVSSFTEVGLNPQHAKLFEALNPQIEVDQINPETVAKFAADYGLTAVSGDLVQAPEEPKQGFTPVVTGTNAPLATYSADEFQELSWDEQKEAVKNGRVQKDAQPWRVQE